MTDLTRHIDVNSLMAISATLKAVPVSEAPNEVFEQFLSAQKTTLENEYTQFPSTSDNPTYKDYATIVVKGKVVAHIDNHGWVMTSNAGGGYPEGLIKEADSRTNVTSGPELAQSRAETIAAYMHGTVVKASTAMTQNAYEGVAQPTAVIDYQAMQKDARFQELEQLRQNRAAFLAQQAV